MPMLSAGARIDEYTVVRHVTTGAMSEVYECRHVVTELRAAAKVLSPELCSDEELVARFRNEAQALQWVRHEHIVKVFASGTLPEGPPYMILEWLPTDLHRQLVRSAPLSVDESRWFAHQLAQALAELHRRGFVHRDLKPANVLLEEDGPYGWNVKLADLGLAKALMGAVQVEPSGSSGEQSLNYVSTAQQAHLGSQEYMAPEQWSDAKTVNDRSDVYALGVLLFQMLTGQLPFTAGEQKDLMYFHLFEPPPLHLLEGLAPVELRDCIARMLDKRPEQRPSMTEVLQCTHPAR